jgi:hypothetical protein
MRRRESKPSSSNPEKKICCGISSYHRHCVICRKRLCEDQRVFCGDVCRNHDRRERRKLLSIECWVEPIGAGVQKRRAWIPRSIFRLRHRGRCDRSGARRAPQKQIGQGCSRTVSRVATPSHA